MKKTSLCFSRTSKQRSAKSSSPFARETLPFFDELFPFFDFVAFESPFLAPFLTIALAALPLLAGALLMLGLMYLFGMKYNYMNLIAVPIILGIGIDDGVHALEDVDLLVRWHVE